LSPPFFGVATSSCGGLSPGDRGLRGEQDHHRGWTGNQLKCFLGGNPPRFREGGRPEEIIVAHLSKLGLGGEQPAAGLLGIARGDDAFDVHVTLGENTKRRVKEAFIGTQSRQPGGSLGAAVTGESGGPIKRWIWPQRTMENERPARAARIRRN